MEKDAFAPGELSDMAFSGLGIGAAVLDADGRVLRWNAEMARFSGVGEAEALAKPFWEAFPAFFGTPDRPGAMPAELEKALSPDSRAVDLGAAELGVGGRRTKAWRRLAAVDRGGGSYVVATIGSAADSPEQGAGASSASSSDYMIEDAKATFWELDCATMAIKANSVWTKRFDVPSGGRGRFFLADYLQRVHPDDRRLVKETIEALMAEARPEPELEYRLREASGNYAWVLDRIMRQERGPDGRLLRCLGRTADVSRRKELEDSVDEKTRLLRQVIDQSPYFVFVRDDGGRFILVNRVMADFYGRSPEELIGASFASVHADAEEAGRLLAEDAHVLRTGETLLLPETALSRADGRKSVMEITLMPFAAPGLRAKAVLGFGVDISDMKRAQRSLYDEKERLSVTLRSLGEGVIATDTAGRVALMNQMAQSATGWDEREARGQGIGSVFRARRGKDGPPVEDPVGEILGERRIVSAASDLFLEKRGGECREISMRGAPIIDEDGKVSGAVIVFVDVTERRAMERELEKVQRLEALGLLAGGIAHDFNNSLMTVLGNISLAKMNMDESDENYAILTDSEKAVLHAKSLTAQLSMMAKGGSEPKKERVGLEGLVRDSCAINLRGSNVDCEVSIEPGLSTVCVDPAQMGQVLQNLIINAKEAMPSGGRIRLSAARTEVADGSSLPIKGGRYVRLDVTDSGVGIPPEVAQRVFDPYFTTKNRGSGLGLTVCFSVAKKHGGCIVVDSAPGEGTTFSIYLPDLG